MAGFPMGSRSTSRSSNILVQPEPNRRKRVAIVGHSHVRRLLEATQGNNFNMSNADVEIRCFFKGGCTIPRLFGTDIMSPMLSFQPDAVIVWIGDNDLKENSSPSDLCGFLFAALEAFVEFCPSIKNIFISPILPRHNGTSRYLFQNYNALAWELNDLIDQEVENYRVQGRSPIINFRRFPEFCFPGERKNDSRFLNNYKFFNNDGVHLNTEGYDKVAKRYKGLIIKILINLSSFFQSN